MQKQTKLVVFVPKQTKTGCFSAETNQNCMFQCRNKPKLVVSVPKQTKIGCFSAKTNQNWLFQCRKKPKLAVYLYNWFRIV